MRITVGPKMIVENLGGGDLSQWTTVLGSGFAIESGWLSASSSGSDNVMVNSSSTTFGDGVVTCDVSNPMPLPSFPDVSLVVRYVDTNNFYLIYPCNNRLKIWKKLSGSYSLMADMTLPDGIMTQNTWYHVQVTLSGSNIKVSWNGQLVVNWTDPSNPFLSGKVGFRQDNSYHTHWDNFIAYTTSAPTVVAYDDYYPFGQYMDGRSYNAGFSDARYKYTEKERDGETGYDYFGARYYDARVGRWMSVDPLGEEYADVSPYCYALNNPLSLTDPTGMAPDSVRPEAPPTNEPIPMPEVVVYGRHPAPSFSPAMAGVVAIGSADPEPFTKAALAIVATVYTAHFAYEYYKWYNEQKKSDDVTQSSERPKEETPKSHPAKFRPLRGRPAKVNKDTGEIWEKDTNRHAGEHWEVYKNEKDYERGNRDRQVWEDGTTGRSY